jgi:hypothetical protein
MSLLAMSLLKRLICRIQRLIQQPTVIIISVSILFLVMVITMASSMGVSIDAHSHRHDDYKHNHHYHYQSHTSYPSNWFSVMHSSILSRLSLFQSPQNNDLTKCRHAEGDPIRCQYDWSQSTEHNYRSKTTEYYGTFRSVRQRLDHSYHQSYVAERQQVQDSIMEKLISRETTIVDIESGRECNRSLEPWIIFTAGVYGM